MRKLALAAICIVVPTAATAQIIGGTFPPCRDRLALSISLCLLAVSIVVCLYNLQNERRPQVSDLKSGLSRGRFRWPNRVTRS